MQEYVILVTNWVEFTYNFRLYNHESGTSTSVHAMDNHQNRKKNIETILKKKNIEKLMIL